MTRMLKSALAASSCLFILGATASAQDTSTPTITFDAPANGVDLAATVTTENPDFFSKRKGLVTVSGTATEETRLRRVQYRLEGSKRWRTANVIRTNNGVDGGTAGTYVWSFRMRVNRRSDRRVYVRAVDYSNNESDIIGRKIIRRR